MSQLNKKTLSVISVLLMFSISMYAAQKFNVKIIDRQNNDTEYTYVVPAITNVASNVDVSCGGGSFSVNCSGSNRTTRVSTPAQQLSYHVRGATFSLQLADGRVAVVNCESKLNWMNVSGPRRSCRIPLVNNIQAEFDGDNAKLKWPVSIDGKKMESETYRMLAVLDKP